MPASEGTWVMKIDGNGSILWNTIIDNGGGSAFTGIATGIFERFNSGVYTYFCGTSMSNSIRAYKLASNGSLFSSGVNQFDYNGVSPISPTLHETQITNITNSVPDNGIQLFSTDGTNSQDNYFVKAYFNGISGCQEMLAQGIQSPGPSSIINPAINVTSG